MRKAKDYKEWVANETAGKRAADAREAARAVRDKVREIINKNRE